MEIAKAAVAVTNRQSCDAKNRMELRCRVLRSVKTNSTRRLVTRCLVLVEQAPAVNSLLLNKDNNLLHNKVNHRHNSLHHNKEPPSAQLSAICQIWLIWL
ncbi:hypothetical protein AAVH_18834 [Aphelenchoides avenae]|nr:hypothetical protein AAVH_18834 [Aphelenchus avenae]